MKKMYILTVVVPSFNVFESYWYGYGEIVDVHPENGRVVVDVNYGDDRYHADYQAGRFASGLYHATVEEV